MRQRSDGFIKYLHSLLNVFHLESCVKITSAQSNWAKSRIADLSPLEAANGFVRC